ncbi:MAG TPA: hypothetical protein VNU68_35645 [Verrucomicrobiae bacterium]|nr:hypothetical protein [Verrucomicrobiae bacterium]
MNLSKIRDYLHHIPASQKSDEILRIEVAITELLSPSVNVEDRELCKKAGDLLIALESSGIPTFYTQNIKESQHLCPALGQTLLYRNNHADENDQVYENGK